MTVVRIVLGVYIHLKTAIVGHQKRPREKGNAVRLLEGALKGSDIEGDSWIRHSCVLFCCRLFLFFCFVSCRFIRVSSMSPSPGRVITPSPSRIPLRRAKYFYAIDEEDSSNKYSQ